MLLDKTKHSESTKSKFNEIANAVDINLKALENTPMEHGHSKDMSTSLLKVNSLFSQYTKIDNQELVEVRGDTSHVRNGKAKQGLDFEYAGFTQLQSHLKNLRESYPDLIPMLEVVLKEDLVEGISKRVTFVRENFPIIGWKQHLRLRLSGKTKGRLDVAYSNNLYFKGKKCHNYGDLLVALQELGQIDTKDKFEFRPVYCVCQTPEDPTRPFIECAFGQCGCNAWIHPECVGLGTRSEAELKKMKSIICPFCSQFLEGSFHMANFAKSGTLLKDITPGFILNDTVVHDFDIEETNMPHHVWGLEGSACSFKSKAKTFKPTIDEVQLVSTLLSNKEQFNLLMNTPISYVIKPYSRAAFPNGRSKKRIYNSNSHKETNNIHSTFSNNASLLESNDFDLDSTCLPLSEKRRKIQLSSDRFARFAVEGGFVGRCPLDFSEFATARIRVEEMTLKTRHASRTPSIDNAIRCQDCVNICGRFLSRPRKKVFGQRSTALEGGEAAGFLGVSSALDGGVNVIALAGNQFPKSFHTWCSSGKYCGFCMLPLDDEMHQNTAFGIVHYDLHGHCFYMVQQEAYFEVLPFADSVSIFKKEDKTTSCDDDPDGDSHDLPRSAPNLTKKSPPISFDHLHNYQQVDDESCCLCGHSGGALIWFQLDECFVSSPSPYFKGWLGHMPCIEFLLRSNLLQPFQPSFHQAVQEVSSKNEFITPGRIDDKDYIRPNSMFDVLLNNNRCRLCGLNDGIVVRCCGFGCSARAHPLCSSLAEGWKVAQIEFDGCNSIGLICCVHSNGLE